MASRTVRRVKDRRSRTTRSSEVPAIVVTQCTSCEGVHSDGTRLGSVGCDEPAEAYGVGGGVSSGAYKPVPPPRPVGASPAVRGPGAPYVPPPSPGAAPQALHTHSSKFPIESDKGSKVPVVQHYRRSPADQPPRVQAWTYNSMQQTPGPSGATSPPVPLKQTFIYGTRGEEEAKEPSKTKAMTKTYHTLKDMISSRFKAKDNEEKGPDAEAGLNNVTEEMRKSMRERAEQEMANRKEQIYGRPVPQQRVVAPDLQYGRQHMVQMHPVQNNGQYQAPSPGQQMMAQQYLQQQIMMNQQQHMMAHGPGASSTPQHGLVQARSQELLNRSMMNETPQRPHSQIVTDSVYYQQYGMQRGIANRGYQAEVQNTNYATKQAQGNQIDDGRSEMRSPQQLEREILRQRGMIEGRRTASQPQLPLDEDQNECGRYEPEAGTSKAPASRRGSHGHLLEGLNGEHEKDSDDGGFRTRADAQGRSFESKDRPASSSRPESSSKIIKTEVNDKNESIYGGMKQPIYNGQSTQRQIDDDITTTALKKVNPGSTASSDYDKNGGPSSNVDSGRGSAAYSSGRRVGHDTSTESDPVPGPAPGRSNQIEHPSSSKHYHEKNGGDSEWVDIVESELRQILEPKLHGLNINGNGSNQGAGAAGSETVSSVTPPMPPLTPNGSSPDGTPRNSSRFKHQSLPYSSKPDYSSETRSAMPNQRAGWQHTSKHRSGSSKKQEHSSQYKKHVFGLETDITSTTTRSLDLSSMLDGQSDSDVSTQDARAIRRQLQGLENMYCEVLKLLGVRKPSTHNLGKYQQGDPRLAKRRYGSVSSLPSSSVSSRPIRDKRRNAGEQRKKVNDIKGINKRFQRLESHVVTLARSVAHLSSEMRTQHLMIQEMENIRGEITALRNQQRSQSMPKIDSTFGTVNGYGGVDSSSLANPSRVKKLTKFFGDEPPLLRMFLKKLGYEKYASLLESERVGAAELPFLGEERLRALGVPLGPRLRILHEARLALPPSNNPHTTLCIV